MSDFANKRWFALSLDEVRHTVEKDNTALYKIIPFDILLQILSDHKIALVNTSMWDDIYENFFLNESFYKDGKEVPYHYMSDKFYGQCWSRKGNSDALWRIYSQDRKGVQIKTSVGKILDSIPDKKDDGGIYLFGKVDYYSQSKIEGDLKSIKALTDDQFAIIMLQSLLVKRNSFSHESEYRLIYMSKKLFGEGTPIKLLPIDHHTFIERICFDPRADDSYVDRCTRLLTQSFGVPRKKINKSNLYAFKPLRFELE
ncbi:MAG: DUF2971 domain-containing protein [Bacteroidales bacterium]|nr:DUF2971 domain-containing protein [Bacteroidales bacterium]